MDVFVVLENQGQRTLPVKEATATCQALIGVELRKLQLALYIHLLARHSVTIAAEGDWHCQTEGGVLFTASGKMCLS